MDFGGDGSLDPEVLEFYRPTPRNQGHHHHHHQQHQHNHANPQHRGHHHNHAPNQQLPRHHPGSSAASGGSGSGSSGAASPVAASLRAIDLVQLLQERIALLPGGRDRRGGPILCFPANSRADELPIEKLYLLVRYLTFLPEDRVKKLGFTVIVDMRSGTTWHSVKPILKVLEECVGDAVGIAYIIKPDKFMEKHKAQMATTKYSFEIQVISVDNLFREVDPSQLTSDFEGSLPYNHDEWIKIRCRLEEFFTQAHDMWDKFHQIFRRLDRKDAPDTMIEAKHRLEEHRSYRLKVVQAPVHVMEAEAERLTQWLRCGLAASVHGSAGADYLGTSWVCMNPDFQQLNPQVKQTVVQLYEFRAHLQQKWETGRSRLEQIYQLCLFQDDLGQMTDWLDQQKHIFLTQYLDIGQTASQAADLHAEHRQFLSNCSNVREQVARLRGVAEMLADTGHYASQQITNEARQLEHEWKSLTTALEDRSRVLQLSASFHARAEAFLANCPHWENVMRHIRAETVPELNQAVINLQDLWQEAQSAHEEVCSDGRALANHLSSPVPSGSHTSLTAAVDYSEGRKHCTDLMHELWSWFKRLECVHNDRKKRLSARLTLLMFKEDVCQVLAWLSDHGEPFLARQIAIGKSSQRAEQLYNAHMQFEQVAANTLTNAEKLISAADDMAAQAEDPEEILQEATELRRRITTFTNAVADRRDALDLACGFYGHTKELFTWFHHLRQTHNPGEHMPSSIEGMEEEMASFNRFRVTVEGEADRVMAEGENLLDRVRDAEEQGHLKTVLEQVLAERTSANDLFTERQVRLDLCLQLRLFEADVASGMDCLRSEVPTSGPLVDDPRSAPNIGALEEASAVCLAALRTAEEVLQKGGELALAFDSVGVNFPAGGPGSSDSGVGDSVETAVERIQRLMTELAESVSSVDDLRIKLTAELDWRRLEQQSQQVLHWIGNCEAMLRSTAVIPGSLVEADQLSAEHERFRSALNEAHPEAVSCAARAELVLQAGPEHPRTMESQAAMEALTARWRGLVYAAEEKHKLLIAANNWYKTSDQVMSVLTSLEKEYRREEDWCQSEKASASGEPGSFLSHLLNKHAEQKEAFLKACILARRTSDHFLKYLHRQPQGILGKDSVEEKIRSAMSQLMAKEQAVLEAWAARKRRLDECLNFIQLKMEAEELIARAIPPSAEEKQRKDFEMAIIRICSSVESVEWHLHGAAWKELCHRLQARLPRGDTVLRGEGGQGRHSGCTDSGISTLSGGASSSGPPSLGRPPSTTSGVSSTGSEAAVVQDKLVRRREKILNELLQTEKTYVKDLSKCMESYYQATIKSPTSDIQIPEGIVGREATVFCNLAEIHAFHKDIFLNELVKYVDDFLPEDVGHCFVTHASRLASLYVEYCVNKVESAQLLIDEGSTFYQEVQNHCGVSEPVQSFLIKPVQRITKYQLLLKEILDCCDPGSAGELREGMEAMLAVPKKANDGLHLSMLQGLPEDNQLSSLGEVLLQDQFTVWEPKQIIKKGRERRVFLFDVCLIIAKEVPSLPGEHKGRYQYKSRLLLAECNITEHIEGDQCKFALWTGRVPIAEYRLVLRAGTLDIKQAWVRAMREAMQERMLVQSLIRGGTQNKGDSDTGSTTSGGNEFYLLDDYKAVGEGELSVSTHQRVELIEQLGDWVLVRTCGASGASCEGTIPGSLLTRKAPTGSGAGSGAGHAGGRRGSTSSSVKKWLPVVMHHKDKKNAGGKRGSKAEQQVAMRAAPPACVAPATAAVESVLDNVSEESVEVELPPPMQLQDFPVTMETTAGGSNSSLGPSQEPSEAGESCDANGGGCCDKPLDDTEELGLALEKNLRLSRRSRRHAEAEQRRARPHAMIEEELLPGDTPQSTADKTVIGGSEGGGVCDAGGHQTPNSPGQNSQSSGTSSHTAGGSGSNTSDKLHSSGGGGVGGGGEELPRPPGDGDEEDRNPGDGGGAASASVSRSLSLEDREKLLQRRRQPIYELVASEQAYVRGLLLVRDKYMTALEMGVLDTVPDDLVKKWPIVWGNWAQLTDWHSTFLARLEQMTNSEEDAQLDCVPTLFIDYTGRLRSMYSKYCENQRKAAVIVEQYSCQFDELRRRLGDKEDVASHLMHPVQRIMRYQLPMAEVVKLTRRLGCEMSSQAELWTHALRVMRTLPQMTQLIIEAARIDGYKGKITALGDIRMRGDLQVAMVPSNSSSSGTVEEDLQFQTRRVFLFEQAVLITESEGSGGNGGGSGHSENCTYLFKHAVNVNRMRFQPRWSLPIQEPNSTPSTSSSPLVFAITDTTPNRANYTFLLDPMDEATRTAWITPLDQLHKMQQNLLLALQDPKRFNPDSSDSSLDSHASNSYGLLTGSGSPAPMSGGARKSLTVASSAGLLDSAGGSNKRKDSCPTSVNFGVNKSSNKNNIKTVQEQGNGNNMEKTAPVSKIPMASGKKKHSILSLFHNKSDHPTSSDS